MEASTWLSWDACSEGSESCAEVLHPEMAVTERRGLMLAWVSSPAHLNVIVSTTQCVCEPLWTVSGGKVGTEAVPSGVGRQGNEPQ